MKSYYAETLSVFRESMKEKRKYHIKLLGKEFVVYPGVFSPKYFSSTEFFASELPIKKNGTFLEIGCGTGIVSVMALLGGAKKAVCTDINPAACKNTSENAGMHKLSKRVKVLKRDIFPAPGKEKFDVIFWNFPFCYTTKRLSVKERSLFDTKYRSAEKFFRNVGKYKKPRGHIFVGFSTDIGNFEKLEEIALTSDYTLKMAKMAISTRTKLPVSYQIFELIESPFGVF